MSSVIMPVAGSTDASPVTSPVKITREATDPPTARSYQPAPCGPDDRYTRNLCVTLSKYKRPYLFPLLGAKERF